jgi:hypothetical protein
VESNVHSMWPSANKLNIRGEGTSARMPALGKAMASKKKNLTSLQDLTPKHTSHSEGVKENVLFLPDGQALGNAIAIA